MLLAHEWLYGDVVTTRYDHELRKHLELPEHFNPHSTYLELGKYAERVVFTDDVPSMLYEMNQNKQLSIQGIMASARMPYDCFWMEYASHASDGVARRYIDKLHYGVLVRKVSRGIDQTRVRMIVVCGCHSNPNKPRGLRAHGIKFASSITYVLEFKTWPPIAMTKDGIPSYAFEVIWAFNHEKLRFEKEGDIFSMTDELNSLCWVITELVFGIFLITQPRVYDMEHHVPSAKLQKARKRSGKRPLLEYKRITLRIGKTATKHYVVRPGTGERIDTSQDTESDAAIQHRRYHKVMGHFRHYLKGSNPHTVWIEPHYRGDPALGVTFTERDVMR